MKNLINFLKKRFPSGIQMFDTRNICGDYMITIYEKDGITVDYCRGYNYIEIFGLTDEQFEEVMEKANGF